MFESLQGKRYGVVAIDCPWSYATWSKTRQTRAAFNHYDVMTLDEIKAIPIRDVLLPDAAVFVWAINPMQPQAIETIRAWGLRYSAVAFTWAKRTRKDTAWFMGMGHTTRQGTETCYLAVQGKPKRLNKDVRELIVAPIREHSRKPEIFFERAERLYPGPRLEIFARERRNGWDSFGLEVDKFSSPDRLTQTYPQGTDSRDIA